MYTAFERLERWRAKWKIHRFRRSAVTLFESRWATGKVKEKMSFMCRQARTLLKTRLSLTWTMMSPLMTSFRRQTLTQLGMKWLSKWQKARKGWNRGTSVSPQRYQESRIGPEKMKPLKVHVIPGTVPRQAKVRRYAAAHLNFMHSQVRKLDQVEYDKSHPAN